MAEEALTNPGRMALAWQTVPTQHFSINRMGLKEDPESDFNGMLRD
jgi:hypothetical protein